MKLDVNLKQKEVLGEYKAQFNLLHNGHYQAIQASWMGFEFDIIDVTFQKNLKGAHVKVRMGYGKPLSKTQVQVVEKFLGMALSRTCDKLYRKVRFDELKEKTIEEVFHIPVMSVSL
ncbi:MAG: hypothetical protein QXL94_05605 [Candidatus Parvarchaeum sp.]